MPPKRPLIPLATEEPVLSEVEGPLACVELLAPLDLAKLPAVGKVTFEWSEIEGADTYNLNFTLPSGDIVTFETDGTTRDRYMEGFGMAGEFEWNVTALNNGEGICRSDFFTFSKLLMHAKDSTGTNSNESGCVPSPFGCNNNGD